MKGGIEMHDLWKELERTCERATHELSQINDRLDQNKNVISPADLDNLFKLMDIVKDVKSTMKKIIEIDKMESDDYNQNEGYSGSYMNQPMWDRRYSGNNYHGTYTVATGDGYSGRHAMRYGYSRNTERDDLMMKLENALSTARTKEDAEAIRKAMEVL